MDIFCFLFFIFYFGFLLFETTLSDQTSRESENKKSTIENQK